MTSLRTLLIAGGGPAGMMAGLLFARAGVPVRVLEKHSDFLRDFRGDTVHPSTIELFGELGLREALLARPHDEAARLTGLVAGQSYRIADFSRLPVQSKFIALMPQWHFLDFVADEARKYPAFALRMDTQAIALVEEDGRVAGVRTGQGEELRADLVIMADGRGSLLRTSKRLPVEDLGAPMDVFWFELPKERGPNRTTGVFQAGRILAMIDRGDYWQCAYVFPKGTADAVRARGIDRLKADVEAATATLGVSAAPLKSWDEVKLLSVSLDRLTCWHAPGLLAIGDAAHAMSPVGGVGINLAIQDAVAAANILAGPMAAGADVDPLLAKVQERRMFPTRVIQGGQRMAHDRVIGKLLASEATMTRAPLPIRMIDRFPALQGLLARVVGLGVRREHIRSPVAR